MAVDAPPLSPPVAAALADAAAVEVEYRVLQARRNDLAQHLEHLGAAGETGHRSTARLLEEHLRVDPGEAKRLLSHGELTTPGVALSGEPLAPVLPATACAATQGEIGDGHVTVIARTMRRIAAVPGLAPSAFPEAEAVLAETARTLAPKSLECAARELLARLDPDGVAPLEDDEPDTVLLTHRRRDGSLCGRFRIAERADAETVATALDALSGRRDPDDLRDLGARQGQALVEMAAGTLADPDDELSVEGGVRPHVAVTIDWPSLRAGTGFGLLDNSRWELSAQATRMLACDAVVLPAVLGANGEVLDLGHSRRLVSAAQRRALILRDKGCAHPGCRRRPANAGRIMSGSGPRVVPPTWTSTPLLSGTLPLVGTSSQVNHPTRAGWGRSLRGREYLRVSLDRSGRSRSTEEQRADNQRDAQTSGIVLGEPYRDDSRSASRYATKSRDDFQRLMADLHAGQFDADVLYLWESSRGSRRVGEWVELIETCEQRGVLIRVTTHARTYDPANGRDRRSLLEDAVDSEYESSKVSARAKRAAAANAASGKPHGRCPYGFRRRYDPQTRGYVGQEPHPEEAPLVAELFTRVIAGHSLRSIALDYRARDVEKRSGGPFTAQHLRSMLLNPAYAGLRVHDTGRKTGGHHSLSPNARMTPGQWLGIVSEPDFWAVQRTLTDPARIKTRPGRGKHLLSMIARCAECGAPLAATTRGNGRQYQCHERGCVRVDADDLDREAETLILVYLARPDVHRALGVDHDPDEDVEHSAVRDEIDNLRARLDELADAVAAGAVSVTLASRTEPQLLERLKLAEQREHELSTPSALRGLLDPGRDATENWKTAPTSTRREFARLLFAPDLLGTLTVIRRPEGRRGGAHRMAAVERILLDRTLAVDTPDT